ncbi:NAC domain-containing protein 67-like [Olea europaea var. sylvestris]|uniref:NAC domain-containing protein 67-like n=1 Tax=Olea europaea var. sylvestris TaxID=158386 RepID=UPI000C1D40AE|nr:NAC domain-containing protein 67-like [Olea europaea var. sylvestris]
MNWFQRLAFDDYLLFRIISALIGVDRRSLAVVDGRNLALYEDSHALTVLDVALTRPANTTSFGEKTLADDYGVNRAEEWFFFTSRDREHENEKIQNGVTVDGYWQVIGEDDEIIKQNNETLGFRKILEFYKGNPPNGDNTSWIMHEIKVNDQHTVAADDTKLDDWIVCRIYRKDNRWKDETWS